MNQPGGHLGTAHFRGMNPVCDQHHRLTLVQQLVQLILASHLPRISQFQLNLP